MNEQIKGLYQQALYEANRIYANMEVEPEDEFDVWYYGVVAEKFAELLLNDVAQFVEDKFDFRDDEIVIAESIKDHFGVQE